MFRRRDFLKHSLLLGGASCFGLLGKAADLSSVGKVWKGWEPGQFQVHFIYTGGGEKMFHIFPDGTTLLLDCGDHPACKRGKLAVEILPDQSRHSGEWVARYVHRVNPAKTNVDYMLSSHFHNDHTGDDRWHAGLTKDRGDDYYLSGFAQAAEFLKFGKAFDRGWPTYDEPLPHTSHELTNMKKLYKWLQKRDNLQIEKFKVGAINQLKLLKDPRKWQKDFTVRNICGNGKIALRDGTVKDLYEGFNGKWINENGMSLGSIFTYGKFKLYTAGDFSDRPSIKGKKPTEVEDEIAEACERVNVCKINHHGYYAMPAKLLKALRSQVYVSCVWDQLHNLDCVMTRLSDREIYPGDRLLCPGIMPKERRTAEGKRPWMKDVALPSYAGGHIVVDVPPGGEEYTVTYLTAADESMRITGEYHFRS